MVRRMFDEMPKDEDRLRMQDKRSGGTQDEENEPHEVRAIASVGQRRSSIHRFVLSFSGLVRCIVFVFERNLIY